MLMCSSYQPVLAPSLINKCKSVPRVKLLNVPQSCEVRVGLTLNIIMMMIMISVFGSFRSSRNVSLSRTKVLFFILQTQEITPQSQDLIQAPSIIKLSLNLPIILPCHAQVLTRDISH